MQNLSYYCTPDHSHNSGRLVQKRTKFSLVVLTLVACHSNANNYKGQPDWRHTSTDMERKFGVRCNSISCKQPPNLHVLLDLSGQRQATPRTRYWPVAEPCELYISKRSYYNIRVILWSLKDRKEYLYLRSCPTHYHIDLQKIRFIPI